MKKVSVLLFVFALVLGARSNVLWAADLVPSASQPAVIDKNHLEGWIIDINYIKNHFRLLDPRGFQCRVVTKLGVIGDYRIGDHVKVEIDPDYKRASLIEKLY